VALLEQIPDPAARLRRLVYGAMTGSRGAAIAVMLLADGRARHHALAGYTAYLGAAVLRRALPQAAPVPDDSYIDTLLSALGVTPSVEPAG
jgi:hypothetical protein